jgi:muramoyltetrapeptide carboxypeptidase LdcA involved in peptidoglycan recycling
MEAFGDPSVQAIVSTIGGDDSLRLIPRVDLRVIRDHPKVFMGYSDTTVAHMLCYQAGLTSFYGPSIMSGFGENAGIPPCVAESVRRTDGDFAAHFGHPVWPARRAIAAGAVR